MSIPVALHLLPESDKPAVHCKACGKLIIKSDADDAPKFMTDDDKYWRMQSDVRCSPMDVSEKKMVTLVASKY